METKCYACSKPCYKTWCPYYPHDRKKFKKESVGMKRSEMVQHIYEELLTKLDSPKFGHGSNVWSEWVANELLDMIEGFGMLPPCKPWNDEICSTWKSIHKWEKEDD